MFKPPIFIQFVLGILGGIGADLDNLIFMKRTAVYCLEMVVAGRYSAPVRRRWTWPWPRRDNGRQCACWS